MVHKRVLFYTIRVMIKNDDFRIFFRYTNMKTSNKIFLFFDVLCGFEARKTVNYASYLCSYMVFS